MKVENLRVAVLAAKAYTALALGDYIPAGSYASDLLARSVLIICNQSWWYRISGKICLAVISFLHTYMRLRASFFKTRCVYVYGLLHHFWSLSSFSPKPEWPVSNPFLQLAMHLPFLLHGHFPRHRCCFFFVFVFYCRCCSRIVVVLQNFVLGWRGACSSGSRPGDISWGQYSVFLWYLSR